MFWLLLFGAVAAAELQAVRDLAALDVRVAQIGERLASSGLCPTGSRGPGWVVQDLAQYNGALRPAARQALGLGELPTIVGVVPGSAADRSGLRAGDQLERVGASAVSAGGEGYARLQQVEDWVDQGLARGGVAMRLRRGGAAVELTLRPEPGCGSRFQLLPGAGLNAKADGRYVQVSGGLVEFVGSDDELALVIAHELAHNILGHRARLDAAGTSRGLFAGFGKNRTRIRETELEADRFALYLMARAGYDPAIAPAFWARFGRKLVPGFLSDGTHPGTAERVRRAEAEIARIRQQQEAGQQPTP